MSEVGRLSAAAAVRVPTDRELLTATAEAFARLAALLGALAERDGAKGEILTTREAASRLRISATELRTLADRHELPCFRVGRLLRFRSEDVDTFVRRRMAAVR